MVVICVSAMVPRLSLFALLLFPVALLHAHHSAAAEFDTSKPVTLRGKVTKVDWMNPHVFIWVDVPDASGAVTNWQVETVAPNYLRRLGWTKQSLKTGDMVTIQAFMAKDQPHLAKTDAVTLPGGRTVTTGRADDGADSKHPPNNLKKKSSSRCSSCAGLALTQVKAARGCWKKKT